MSTATQPLLQVQHLSHSFGSSAVLHDVCLDIAAGAVHCLVGPSGSGKSTLLRLIAGLEVCRSGRVDIAGATVADGESGRQLAPERRAVGFVFQDYALFPHLDVLANIEFGIRASRAERRSRAAELLRRVGLEHKGEAMPHTLSGGEQQRVALARALAPRPRVLLLDEPFSGLDERLRDDVRRSTLEVVREADVATLIVTHDPREALRLGDQVSVMHAGRLLQTGDAHQVYAHSVDSTVARIFGEVNELPGRIEQGHVHMPVGIAPLQAEVDATTAVVLVRPESIRLRRPTDPTSAGDRLHFEAEIVDVERVGALHEISLRAGDLDLHAHALGHDAPSTGERVRAEISHDALMIVPAD